MVVTGFVFGQSLADFPRQIQPGKTGVFLLQFLDDPQALAIVLKPAVVLHQFIEDHLALMAEGRVPQIVRQRDGFGQVFIQLQGTGDVAGDGGDFHRMRQPCAQMVARAVQEHLRLVFEPAKRARVNDAVAIALVVGAPVGRFFRILAAAGVRAELGVRREVLPLQLFQFFAGARHVPNSEFRMSNIERGISPACRRVAIALVSVR